MTKSVDGKNWRVCMLIDSWEPVTGGGPKHVLELARRLKCVYGARVDIFTRRLKDEQGRKFCDDEVLEDSVPVVQKDFGEGRVRVLRCGFCADFFCVPARVWWIFSVCFAVAREHRREHYDLIHAHAFLSGLPGKFMAWMLKLPIVYTVHGTSLGLNRRGLFTWMERYLLTRVKYDQVISVAENFLQFKNVNKEIVVISNGVDCVEFDRVELKSGRSGERADRRGARDEDFFKILYVGRFDEIKGVDILIRAFGDLCQRRQELIRGLGVQLHLVGYGAEEESLRKLAAAMGGLIFFKGKKSGEDLIREYKEAALFVLPSRSEGQPLTIFEAWAAKVPVLVTNVGDNAKYVKEGVNGFLCEAGEVEALGQALEKILEKATHTRDGLKGLGANGYALVKKQFSWERMAERVMGAYQEVVCDNKK